MLLLIVVISLLIQSWGVIWEIRMHHPYANQLNLFTTQQILELTEDIKQKIFAQFNVGKAQVQTIVEIHSENMTITQFCTMRISWKIDIFRALYPLQESWNMPVVCANGHK